MKVIYNNIIPFKGFLAINLFGVIFARKQYKSKIAEKRKQYTHLNSYTINHEAIHTAQMKELLYIGFYIWYFIEWIIQLIINIKNPKNAYYEIRFEKEAFQNENNLDYLKTRKQYNWIKL